MQLETSTKPKTAEFETVHIPEGIYTLELLEVKNVSDGEYGPRIAFVYNVMDRNVQLVLICYKLKATSENKLGQTLLAHGLKIDDEVKETDSIVSTKVKGWVDDYTPRKREGDDKEPTARSIISKVKKLDEVVEQPAV